MALATARTTFTKLNGYQVLLQKTNACLGRNSGVANVIAIQASGMRLTWGEPFGYEKPWPYETTKFNFIHSLYDSTTARLNENSKAIVVEGLPGVGKREFAERLAKNFDLKVIDPVSHDEIYTFYEEESKLDMRIFDQFLPYSAQLYDFTKFYRDPEPEKGTMGRLQLQVYAWRYYRYAEALYHLLNTGQGVVVPRSVWGDSAIVGACRRMKWVTKPFVDYYNDYRDNSICELLRPHITIYLDAPVDVCMKRIKARGHPEESKSKNMNEKFLSSMEAAYKQDFLPKMRQSGAVMEIDWTESADSMDMDVICEEVARVVTESEDSEDKHFEDWRLDEEELCHNRRYVGDRLLQKRFLQRDLPLDCPEVLYSADDNEIRTELVYRHPAMQYKTGWSSELGNNVLFRV